MKETPQERARRTPPGQVLTTKWPVLTYGRTPRFDPARWRFRCFGLVEEEVSWTWQELLALPQRSVFATVECAGNGRSFLGAPMPGVQWGAGAIGHAEWTGVPLSLVLAAAGVRPGVSWVIAEGADACRMERSIPLAKAMDDILVAYAQNGEPVRPHNGYPLRLIVPGWEAIRAVKWLSRIAVGDRPAMACRRAGCSPGSRSAPRGR